MRHNDVRLMQVQVPQTALRQLRLAGDALDGLLDHGLKVLGQHFDEFWQWIDLSVIVGWMVMVWCRLRLSAIGATGLGDGSGDGSGPGDLRWLQNCWIATAVWIVLGLVLRALNFAMMTTNIGVEITTIIQIMENDVVKFFKLLMILSGAFGLTFMIVYRDNPDFFVTWSEVFSFCFELAFGMTDISTLHEMERDQTQSVGALVFWVYFLLVNVVLLNLLIAFMSSTYEDVVEVVRRAVPGDLGGVLPTA